MQATLVERMHAYEARFVYDRVSDNRSVAVRVDGKCFRTYTRSFTKPFDARLHTAMVQATIAVLKEWPGAVAGLTNSDEASFLFPVRTLKNGDESNALGFRGRIQKITSLVASLFSVVFNQTLKEECKDRDIKIAMFDARVFEVGDSRNELVNAALERYRAGERNSKQSFACHYLPAKSLEHVTANDAIARVEAEKGAKWDDLPGEAKYGTLVLRDLTQLVQPWTFTTLRDAVTNHVTDTTETSDDTPTQTQ